MKDFRNLSSQKFVPPFRDRRPGRAGRSRWPRKFGWLALLSVLTATLVAVWTVGPAAIAPPARAQADQPETLLMGTSADYPPFEFYDTSGGEERVIGFDVDIAREIGEQLGFEVEIQDMDFSGLIPSLQSGRVDFVMAGMTPTPERAQNVDFSIIYYEARNTIVSKTGQNLSDIDALQGKIVGVQLGTIQEEFAREIEGIELVNRNKIGDLIQEIKAGRIDAAIIEDTVAKGYTTSNPDLEFFTIPSTEETGSAIAFPKGSPLVDDFNGVLQTLLDDGTIDRLVVKWFENEGEPVRFGFQQIVPSMPYILKGLFVTLQFTLLSAVLGFIWGTILALFKISQIPPLYWFATAYTSVFRGTPLILQIALVYFATPQLIGYDISAFQAGVITFALNSGAYISETIRAGIAAVDRGQTEAAQSLGVPYPAMMLDIILPQALRNILPALVNESIALLKDSALVSTIGAADLLRRAQVVAAEKYIYFEPLLFAGLVYYLLVMALTVSSSVLERRLKQSA